MSSQLVPQMMRIHDLRLGFFSISFLLLLNFFVRVVLQHRCFDLMMTSLKSSRASISHRSFFLPHFSSSSLAGAFSTFLLLATTEASVAWRPLFSFVCPCLGARAQGSTGHAS